MSPMVVRSPRIYRLRHQEYTPAPKTKPGMRISDRTVTLFCCAAVIVTRRSSGSLGRIEIRFSCCESQPIVFMNKSRLPGMPSADFDAKSESPNTTIRVSGLGAFASPGFGASDDGADTAAATVTGPGLSPLAASIETLPDVNNPLISDSAQL